MNGPCAPHTAYQMTRRPGLPADRRNARVQHPQQGLDGVERGVVARCLAAGADELRELHAEPELGQQRGDGLCAESRRQIDLVSLQRLAYTVQHKLFPGLDTRQELLSQFDVGQTCGPQFSLNANEA